MCGHKAKSKRSRLCLICFKNKSRTSGAKSAGREGGNPGNRGNVGGNPGNSGNTMRGAQKRFAGHRSGLRRCAALALTVKKKWLDLILAGTKTWEIRGTSTKKRGFIHFAESGSGQLRGRAKLVDCRQLDRCTLMKHQCFHQLPNAEMVKYKNIWAWILKDAEPYEMPFYYSHKQGAEIFVTVRKRMGPQRSAEVEPPNQSLTVVSLGGAMPSHDSQPAMPAEPDQSLTVAGSFWRHSKS